MSTRSTVYYPDEEMQGLHLFQDLADRDSSVVWLEYERSGFAVLIPLPDKLSAVLLKAQKDGKL